VLPEACPDCGAEGVLQTRHRLDDGCYDLQRRCVTCGATAAVSCGPRPPWDGREVRHRSGAVVRRYGPRIVLGRTARDVLGPDVVVSPFPPAPRTLSIWSPERFDAALERELGLLEDDHARALRRYVAAASVEVELTEAGTVEVHDHLLAAAGLRHHLSLHARLLDERLVLSDPAG
jgi:hypothetical protein